jgi:hypothetical protein
VTESDLSVPVVLDDSRSGCYLCSVSYSRWLLVSLWDSDFLDVLEWKFCTFNTPRSYLNALLTWDKSLGICFDSLRY